MITNDEINQETVDELYREIRLMEGQNVRTGKYTDKMMVQQIANVIISKVKEEKRK